MTNEKKGYTGEERRRAKRTRYPYVMRVKQISPPIKTKKWDAPTLKNISKVGIAFYALQQYLSGTVLETELNNPLDQQVQRVWGTVVRCCQSEQMKNFHEVAVSINKVEEPRDLFDQRLDLHS